MSRFLPVLLLFIFTLYLNKEVAAQDTAATKANTDTLEEVVRACSFPSSLDAEFPGGEPGWQRFLARRLVYPKKAKRKKIEGIVTVEFVVSKDGFVTDVTVFSGPKELRQSAVDVVMKSGKWSPAIQSGRQVKAYKKSDIVFKLNKE